MKYALLAILVLSVSACGPGDYRAAPAGFTGNATETCIDGVTYLQFTSGAAVKVDRAGIPVPC